MNNWNHTSRNDDRNDDKPAYSRIFIVCSKQMRAEDLRPAFEVFGQIEDLHMPKDRKTGESKGIAYIKYSKTSSAAAAIQEMNCSTIKGSNKPLRVMISANRHEDQNPSEEKFKRLFIKCKDVTESELKEHFSQFGRVESVHIQHDNVTGEPRGFAYVNYGTRLEAAKAFEDCDRKYKPIFATPKEELKRSRKSIENLKETYLSSNSSITKDNFNDFFCNSQDFSARKGIVDPLKSKPPEFDSICVACTPPVPQKYIESLFNIIPGMVQCKYTSDPFNGLCKASITYKSSSSAAHAVERLNNFEFPSGEIISVKRDDNPLSKAANNLVSIVNSYKNVIDSANPGLAQLADAIAQASSLITAATAGRTVQKETLDFCNVPLPPTQPLASSTSTVAKRCFLVFRPHLLPTAILKDVFCRFGDLIDVSTFPEKTFGFAKFASMRAADEAIKTLHGATVCGVTLKVLEADEKPSKTDKISVDEQNNHDTERKRMKLHDSE